jgi:hypothetical protein
MADFSKSLNFPALVRVIFEEVLSFMRNYCDKMNFHTGLKKARLIASLIQSCLRLTLPFLDRRLKKVSRVSELIITMNSIEMQSLLPTV